jgi:hypothetical protein
VAVDEGHRLLRVIQVYAYRRDGAGGNNGMKIIALEYEGCFAFDLTAETIQEAALLARFGMNHTKELRTAYVNVSKEGTFYSSIVVGKRKDNCGVIART